MIGNELRARLIEDLSPVFKGSLIGPDDAAYEKARRVWNAMAVRRPGLIARCTGTSDVVAAVDAARRHHLFPSVRGGGHSVSGLALSDGGLTIDLSGMRRVGVDPRTRLVHADGGCLLSDIDDATAPHGLIVPLGIVSATGLGGLALGGGVGWFSRVHGLTCDNFASLEVVLAGGEVVRASPDEHPDLFWALRGGGGNLGVVTRFALRAHPFGPMMRIGVALYHPDDAREALREYARVNPTLPRTVGWHGVLKRHMPPLPFAPDAPTGGRMLMLIAMWLDDPDHPDGISLLQRLGRTGRPCMRTTAVVPFGHGLQRSIDHEFPDGKRNYTREAHLTGLTEGAIDTIVDFWTAMPMNGEIAIISLGGAMGDTPEDQSAFANRRHPWWLHFGTYWDDPARDDDHIALIRRATSDLAPATGTGVYVNVLNFDETDRIVEAYGGRQKYDRLARIKAAYDPDNRFRINHNIPPRFD